MFKHIWKQFLILVIILSAIIASTEKRPVVRWIHGINDTCLDEISIMGFLFANFDAKCIETSRGQLKSFTNQIAIACEYLNSEIEILKDGFTLIGMSQGGLIARGVLQKCEAGKYVKRLLTIGTPHNGVALIPHTTPGNIINHVILPLCLNKILPIFVGPCSYIRSLKYFRQYLDSENIISDLNNENNENVEYKNRISQLEVFMTVQFSRDTMVQPGSSAVFGFYSDKSYSGMSEMEEEDVYKKDRIGLINLQRSGRLFRCQIDDLHMHVTYQDYALFLGHFANIYVKNWMEHLPELRTRCRFSEFIEQ